MRRTKTELMLKVYGLTRAQIFYRMSDLPSVINTLVWQGKIEGQLHWVRFTQPKLISPREWRNVVGELRLQ